jgi:putative copper export protein
VCAPHGLAITRRQRITLEMPGKAGFHMLLGLIVAMLITKRPVRLPSCGICDRCTRERRVRLLAPVACMIGCLLTFVAGAMLAPHPVYEDANPTTFDPTVMSGSAGPMWILTLLSLALFLAAVVLPMSRLRPGWDAVTRMSIHQAQSTVTFKRPAPAFMAAYRRTQKVSLR